MKWKLILAIAICVAVGAATAFALNTTINAAYTFLDPSGAATTIIFQPSTQVTVGINNSAAFYAVNAKHFNGDRIYGAASNDSKIWWLADTAGTVLSGAPSTTGVDAFSSNYHTL